MIRVAITDDPVPVALDHLGELLEGLEPLPAQLGFPVLEESPSPERVFVIPELPEGLLEQIRLVEPFVGLQQRAQGPSALGIQIGFVGQQRIALALDELALFVIDAFVLAAADPIQGTGNRYVSRSVFAVSIKPLYRRRVRVSTFKERLNNYYTDLSLFRCTTK